MRKFIIPLTAVFLLLLATNALPAMRGAAGCETAGWRGTVQSEMQG